MYIILEIGCIHCGRSSEVNNSYEDYNDALATAKTMAIDCQDEHDVEIHILDTENRELTEVKAR